ncbi:MAG: D-alanine--D-alanine ligase [Bdellovibrionota bacterium]
MKQGSRPQNIWVLCGGPSREREVSLKTGAGVTAALEKKGFAVKSFDVRPETLDSLPWASKPDIVFIALHGHFGEDGVVQGYLETRSVPYVGSGVLSSSVSFHKGFTKSILVQDKIPTPAYVEFNNENHFHEEERSGRLGDTFFAKSWFIKPAQEGSTIGIERYRADQIPEGKRRETFLRMLQSSFKFCEDVVIEEWVEGAEVTVPIFEGRALPAVEIRPKSKFYDYQSKYTVGATEYFCPAPLSADITSELASLAVRTFHVLKCQDYGRIDFIVGPQGPVVLEMNTLPGMTPTSLLPKSAAADGLSYEDFVEQLVCFSYRRQLSKFREGGHL